MDGRGYVCCCGVVPIWSPLDSWCWESGDCFGGECVLEWAEEGLVGAFGFVMFDYGALVNFVEGGLEASGLLGELFARGKDVVA